MPCSGRPWAGKGKTINFAALCCHRDFQTPVFQQTPFLSDGLIYAHPLPRLRQPAPPRNSRKSRLHRHPPEGRHRRNAASPRIGRRLCGAHGRREKHRRAAAMAGATPPCTRIPHPQRRHHRGAAQPHFGQTRIRRTRPRNAAKPFRQRAPSAHRRERALAGAHLSSHPAKRRSL